MSDSFKLQICQGKYEYDYSNGYQTVKRNGQPWPAMDEMILGNKFVYSLVVELDESQKEVKRLTAELAEVITERNTLQRCYMGYQEELAALKAELSELRNSMGFRTSLIGRLETELAALKVQSEPVYCVVTDDGTYEHHKEWVPLADCFVLYKKGDS